MKKTLSFGFLFAAGILLFSPFLTHAQFSSADIVLSMTPELPGPEQNVAASISSFSVPLSRSKIAWYLDGKLKDSGTDKKSFSFTSPKTGTTLTLSVVVTLPEGGVIERTFSVTPRELDLLWEASDSYVPPFYKGKALPAAEALIKVVAMPSAGTNAPSDLIYSWERGNRAMPDDSGHGRQSFTFRNSYNYTNEAIKVDARTVNNSYVAERQTTITMESPRIILYEKDRDAGILYNQAFTGGFSVSAKDLMLVAEPYFFSPAQASTTESLYTWLVDDTEVRPLGKKNELIIPNTGKEASVFISIESIAKLFQEATASATIRFR